MISFGFCAASKENEISIRLLLESIGSTLLVGFGLIMEECVSDVYLDGGSALQAVFPYSSRYRNFIDVSNMYNYLPK